jgi:hypothetical protein
MQLLPVLQQEPHRIAVVAVVPASPSLETPDSSDCAAPVAASQGSSDVVDSKPQRIDSTDNRELPWGACGAQHCKHLQQHRCH